MVIGIFGVDFIEKTFVGVGAFFIFARYEVGINSRINFWHCV